MKNIICYRKGCNQPAEWTIPGSPTIHLCARHLRELFPDKDIVAYRIEPLPAAGPTEFKDEENDNEYETK